ncbi:dna replication licensing factor mcm2 [Hordeum vulgare]|nr:dna replication licensing factor mcm2 [Hordeum vulgare]
MVSDDHHHPTAADRIGSNLNQAAPATTDLAHHATVTMPRAGRRHCRAAHDLAMKPARHAVRPHASPTPRPIWRPRASHDGQGGKCPAAARTSKLCPAALWTAARRGIKHDIRLGLRISVCNGSGTEFWLDPWLDGEPLRLRFPRLFAICGDPAALVAASAREDGWHVAFRRPLGPAEAHEWAILQVVVPLLVSSDKDSVLWSLSPSGHFSVSSAYLALCRTPVIPWLSSLWKAPLPLKIKIFVWQLLRDRLPSGTEVLKRHGSGNGTCPLCDVPENGTHILFSCVAAQALWGFVREALGPEWEAHDLADFLQVQATQAGRKRRLSWLVFAALTWTLWTTRNKMLIERLFQRHASDSFFKFLAFLQHWHPFVRPRDRDRLQSYLDALLTSARRLSHRPDGA